MPGISVHLDAEQTFCVLEKDLAFSGFRRAQPSQSREDVGPVAWGSPGLLVGAIAAKHDLVLVLLKKPAGMPFVARQGVEPGAGGNVRI